jgi:cold shock CspA family protein
MPTGYITYYNPSRKFGFIDCPELNYFDIYFHHNNINSEYKHIFPSDHVDFELKKLYDENQLEANEIKFIRNSTLEYLHQDFVNKKTKKGFLKKIQDNYYVKDSETYLFIKLRISPYETELFNCYESKLNAQINYQIVVFSNKNKIRAINTDRKYSIEYLMAVSGNNCIAKVENKIKGGYKILVEEKIIGFIPDSIAYKHGVDLIEDFMLKVRCIQNNESSETPVFEIL